jgi:ABC-type uncharacterized transport system ATPase subunit
MKMELLAALIHRPEVLFLDEPTIGLDAVSQVRMRDFLRRLNQEMGTTILLTSHYMEDVRALCPRALVIHQGQLRHDGETESGLELMLRLAAELHEEEAAEMTLTSIPSFPSSATGETANQTPSFASSPSSENSENAKQTTEPNSPYIGEFREGVRGQGAVPIPSFEAKLQNKLPPDEVPA